jgi:hypothetical protein
MYKFTSSLQTQRSPVELSQTDDFSTIRSAGELNPFPNLQENFQDPKNPTFQRSGTMSHAQAQQQAGVG